MKLPISNPSANYTFAQWCSFCSAEEATAGELTVPINDEMISLPICPKCLARARATGNVEELDTTPPVL